MKDKCEIIMAGSGGQGLVSCGIILAEAAMLEGKNVVQTQSYGIATRGGFSKSEVIISNAEIIFQKVEKPNIILALTDEAMEMYSSVPSSVPIYYDTTFMKKRSGENLYGYSFTAMANELGHVGMANIIALGAMANKTNLVGITSLEKVIYNRFSRKVAELNIIALHKGNQLKYVEA